MPTGTRPSRPASRTSNSNDNARPTSNVDATAASSSGSYAARTKTAKHSKVPAPTKAATAHAKAMIETLHQELQPDFLKISDDLITAFAHVKRKEEALQKLKDDDDSIPSSCLIGLVLEPNGRSTKESTEFKTLDAETSAIIRDCQARLKKQVIKCVSLNLAELKHGVVKSLAKALPILAMGFSAEVDIDDEKYSEHQAVADMLYCYGEDVISALSLGATPASFIKAYKEVNKCSLPPPTKVASSSHPQSPTITIATEPLRLPPQVFNEYAPATAPTTAVLRNPYAGSKRPGNSNSDENSTPVQLGLAQLEFTTRAESRYDSACTNLFSTAFTTPSPRKKKRVRINEPAAPSEPGLEIIEETVLESDAGTSAAQGNTLPPFTQRPNNSQTSQEQSENPANADDTIMNEEPSAAGPPQPSPCPNISHFLSELGDDKTQAIQNMHWMTMTGMIGSIGTYVKTIKSRDKAARIKQRLKSATTEKKASTIASRLAIERAADRPTLEGVVDKGVKSSTGQMNRRLQSLETRFDQKTAQANQKNGKGKKTNGQLKDRRGAKGGAASTKKSDPIPSSRNRNSKGARSAGGSNNASRQGQSNSNDGKSTNSSRKKKPSKPNVNNRSKQQSRKK